MRLSPLILLLALCLLGCSLDRSALGDTDNISPSAENTQETGTNPADASRPEEEADVICIASAELCDGIDNDCDPETSDGSGEPRLGDACDGTDRDLCSDGQLSCIDGSLVCDDSDTEANAVEICDGVDNDCNSDTPDGSDEVGLEEACDGPDIDLCNEGVLQCHSSALTLLCTDNSADSLEVCNGNDDDCDGRIDEDGVCPCDQYEHLGRSYLFCETRDVRNDLEGSSEFCNTLGYGLVSINGAEEHDALVANALGYGNHEWWIGLRKRTSVWLWTDGTTPASFSNWDRDDPRDRDTCATLDPEDDDAPREGSWRGHENEGQERRFICESR